MNAITAFRQGTEYPKYSDKKKILFDKMIREIAQQKSPRLMDEGKITEADILEVKAKISSYK